MSDDQKSMALRMQSDLWDAMDELRGAIPRERWVRDLIEREVAKNLPAPPPQPEGIA